jgi:hypothetical protein
MTLDLSSLYAATGTAKLAELPTYEDEVKRTVPRGVDVTLTGPCPVWLYLRLAHMLHGIARSFRCDPLVTGPVIVFDHNPH